MKWASPLSSILILLYCYNGVYAGFSSVCEGMDNVSETCSQLGLTPQCDSKIYCQGELLCTVQMARIFNDSKTFVDMKLKYPEAVTLENFKKWKSDHKNVTTEDVKEFVKNNFDDVGSEFEPWVPTEHKKSCELKIMKKIKDTDYQEWVTYLHDLWLKLGKKIKPEVYADPSLYSIIPVKNPIIVPGGRFREYYYWDSYWVIHGLLLSEMYTTVRGMLENFVNIVKEFGFVPNGGRIYYSGRSQPPLLTPMVRAYFDATGDYEFLEESLDVLEMEYDYWREYHVVNVKGHDMYVYIEKSCGPRPESYYEDTLTATTCGCDEDRENLYSEIKAAACSGMDFSSRWYVVNGTNKGELKDLKTRSIVAVDLNAWMYYIAKTLAYLHRRNGDSFKSAIKSICYEYDARTIKRAIDEVLWDEKAGCWQDYDLINKKRRNYFVASNFVPLYVECYDLNKKQHISDRIQHYIKTNNLDKFVSLPNTLFKSDNGQQWDYPNVWPPMQHIAVMGLEKLGTKESKRMAYDWSARYIRSNYLGYKRNGHCYMYEKYNALASGVYGGGGEYDIQTGFGWTNGVVLYFLNYYGHKLSSTDKQMLTCDSSLAW